VVKNKRGVANILVVADLEYLRFGIRALLEREYWVKTAGNEEEAIDMAIRFRPDLILISLDQSSDEVAACARRVRARASLSENVPIVMFCVPTIPEGAEVQVGRNTYAARPVHFNQLRIMLRRLSRPGSSRSQISRRVT
jgi:DNA-binding response OmpR family regulator